MQPIEADHFHALLDHLTAAAPELVDTCRWLACGPSMAPLILGRDADRPSAADLAHLAALIDAAPAEAATAGSALLAAHEALLSAVSDKTLTQAALELPRPQPPLRSQLP